MIFSRRPDEPSERKLVALADGSLPVSKRPPVERAVAVSPQLTASVAAQRRALAAVREAASETAPAALRARLELAREPRVLSPLRGLPAFRLGLASTAAAVLAVAALLIAGGGGSVQPTVAAAATLGTRAPLARASGAQNDGGTLPGISSAGIAFPDWQRPFGYVAAGVRNDRFGGRHATTVFYRRSASQIAYTIVSGAPLAAGISTHSTVWEGIRLSSFFKDGRLVVTWLRNGHTCILSSSGDSLASMVRLAGWDGESTPY